MSESEKMRIALSRHFVDSGEKERSVTHFSVLVDVQSADSIVQGSWVYYVHDSLNPVGTTTFMLSVEVVFHYPWFEVWELYAYMD